MHDNGLSRYFVELEGNEVKVSENEVKQEVTLLYFILFTVLLAEMYTTSP